MNIVAALKKDRRRIHNESTIETDLSFPTSYPPLGSVRDTL